MRRVEGLGPGWLKEWRAVNTFWRKEGGTKGLMTPVEMSQESLTPFQTTFFHLQTCPLGLVRELGLSQCLKVQGRDVKDIYSWAGKGICHRVQGTFDVANIGGEFGDEGEMAGLSWRTIRGA